MSAATRVELGIVIEAKTGPGGTQLLEEIVVDRSDELRGDRLFLLEPAGVDLNRDEPAAVGHLDFAYLADLLAVGRDDRGARGAWSAMASAPAEASTRLM